MSPSRRGRLTASPGAATLVLAGMIACAHSQAHPTDGQPDRRSPISAEDLRRRLYVFSDDSMEGRAAGTAGNVKATDYIAREARKLGLEPAGVGGTYFQVVPLISREVDPSGRAEIGGVPLTIWVDYAPRDPGRQVRVADAAEAVWGGRMGEDTARFLASSAAAGKVVVVGVPDMHGQFPGVLNRGMLEARYPTSAAIFVVALEQLPPAFRRFLTGDNGPRFDLEDLSIPPDTAPVGPSYVYVTVGVAQRIMGRSLDHVSVGAIGRTPVSIRAPFVSRPAPFPGRNVVAILRGSDPQLSQEYVAIGGHSDHLGVRRPGIDPDSVRAYNQALIDLGAGNPFGTVDSGKRAAIRVNTDSLRRLHRARVDSVYNGADDDGSGSVSVLEIAQAFARAPVRPKRSILFVWHTGEELGLLGSYYFVEHPTVIRDSIVAQLNMDMIGRGDSADIVGGGPRYLQLIGSRRLSTELGDLVEAVNKTEPEPLVFDYQFDANGHPENLYCRSDHQQYARYGIPIVFFTTGLHKDYHQVTDEPQFIDYPHMARVDRLVYDVARGVADLDHRPVVDKPKPDPHGNCKQ